MFYMYQIICFLFSSFWVWSGSVILLAVAGGVFALVVSGLRGTLVHIVHNKTEHATPHKECQCRK